MGTTQECCLEQILEATLHKTAVVWPTASHLTNFPSKMKTHGIPLEARMKSEMTSAYGIIYVNMPELADQQGLTSVFSRHRIQPRRLAMNNGWMDGWMDGKSD